MNYRYRGNTELPAIPIAWLDNAGAVVDFSTGWTFTAYICNPTAPSVALVAKTSGITGAATSPNVTIDWSTSDFTALTPTDAGATYNVEVVARRTSDSKDEWLSESITITLFSSITGP